ncbi:MAG: ornithine carbamoyltransferase [Gammaproteobacteria bacterium]
MARKTRHFLTLFDLQADEFEALLARAAELKRMQREGVEHRSLAGKVLAMVFEKSSTRTRFSFEAGMFQLGGHAIFASPADSHLGRGEPIEDTARVLSRMVDGVMLRTHGHDRVEQFARHSSAPVINGLSDLHHPCQLLADVMTYEEHRGSIAGRAVTWVGDGNNMCHSFIQAAQRFDFQLNVATPPGFEPDSEIVAQGEGRVRIVHEPAQAVAGADLVACDVFASMGQESEQSARLVAFDGFQVNAELMSHAASDCLVMHCLPAHRDEEISAEVLEGAQSVVWDEAENRLHAQKALLELLLGD